MISWGEGEAVAGKTPGGGMEGWREGAERGGDSQVTGGGRLLHSSLGTSKIHGRDVGLSLCDENENKDK